MIKLNNLKKKLNETKQILEVCKKEDRKFYNEKY